MRAEIELEENAWPGRDLRSQASDQTEDPPSPSLVSPALLTFMAGDDMSDMISATLKGLGRGFHKDIAGSSERVDIYACMLLKACKKKNTRLYRGYRWSLYRK